MKRITTVFILLILSLSTQAQSDTTTGKAPTYIIVEVTIDTPIEKVWAEFADIGGVFLNSPTLTLLTFPQNRKRVLALQGT